VTSVELDFHSSLNTPRSSLEIPIINSRQTGLRRDNEARYTGRTFWKEFLATASPRDANQGQPPAFNLFAPRKRGGFWRDSSFFVGSRRRRIGAGNTYEDWTRSSQLWRYLYPILHSRQGKPNLLFDTVGTPDGIVNVLLIGPDRNWKQGKVFDPSVGKFRPYQVEDKATRPRSDSMIVVSFNRDAHSVRLLSISRDSRVRSTIPTESSTATS
jgi:hypothetical protein